MSDRHLPIWLAPRAARLCGAVLEACLDASGHAGLLARLRTPGFLARVLALSGLPAGAGVDYIYPLLKRAFGHDEVRLAFVVEKTRVMLADGRFAPLPRAPGGAAGVDAAAPIALSLEAARGSKAFQRVAPETEDARLSSAFDLAFLPLPPPFLDVARRPRTGARVVTALALCAEVVTMPAHPSDPMANHRAARAFVSDDDSGVFISVYDETLRCLERMLHRGNGAPERVAPLFALARMLDDGARAGRGAAAPALARRDMQHARLYGFVSRDAARGPRVHHRPTRRASRPVDGFRPVSPTLVAEQGDLFAW